MARLFFRKRRQSRREADQQDANQRQQHQRQSDQDSHSDNDNKSNANDGMLPSRGENVMVDEKEHVVITTSNRVTPPPQQEKQPRAQRKRPTPQMSFISDNSNNNDNHNTNPNSRSSSPPPPPLTNSSSSSNGIFKLHAQQSSTATTPRSICSKGNSSIVSSSTGMTGITSAASVSGKPSSSSHHNKLPGIFTLIEQGKWKKVSERATKYPHECKKSAYIKRKSSSVSSISPRAQTGGGPGRVGLTSAPSFVSTNTFDTMRSSQSSHGLIEVKCKALHHACYKLRNIHSQLHKAINIELDEMNQYYELHPDRLIDNNSLAMLGGSVNRCLTEVLSPRSTKSNSSKKSPSKGSCSNTSSCSNSTPPANLHEEGMTLDEIPTCPSSCGFSFDGNDVENDIRVGERRPVSPSLNRFVNMVKSNIPVSSPTSSNLPSFMRKQMAEEWDDPWIEACKAILTILEMYPDAAHLRETRHGCLPLHLAVFAMRPTPSATLPEEYVKYKYHLSKRKPSPITEIINFDEKKDEVSHKICLAASRNNNDESNPTLPPRPQNVSRGKSNSSTVSMTSNHSSLAGMTTIFMEGGACSFGGASAQSGDSYQQEITESLVDLEERLRDMHNDNKTSAGITTEKQSKLSERSSRPAPISTSNYDRGASIGSTYSAGSTAYSLSSTVLPSGSSPQDKVQNEFYLDKYIANTERRAEYSLRVFNAILNANKGAKSTDSEGGRYPLHNAIVGRASFEIIETLIKKFPLAVRQRTRDLSLPLHLAAYHGVSDARVAPILLRHYPDAAAGKNKWDRTPLEEALLLGGENGRKHQIELVAALRQPILSWTNPNVEKNFYSMFSGEEGIDRRIASIDGDDVNDMSLITLIKLQKWDIIVQNIDCFTNELQSPFITRGKGGYEAKLSALHLVCEYNPTYDVVDALVSACPTACAYKMQPGGQLPLHVAATWKSSRSVIGYLIAAHPGAAKQKDWLGNLPLHCACLSGASEAIIESLLCSFPLAVIERNKQDSTPRGIVKRLSHNNKTEIVILLEKTMIEIDDAKQRNMKVRAEFDDNYIHLESSSNYFGRRIKKSFNEHKQPRQNDLNDSDEDDQNWI